VANPESPLRFEVEGCPLCSSTRASVFDRRRIGPASLVNLICRDCGLIYQSPRPSNEWLETYYSRDYLSDHFGVDDVTQGMLELQAFRARYLVKLVGESDLRDRRCLDIGCGAGVLMQSLQQVHACRAVGVEPSKKLREHCTRQGLNVYASLDELRSSAEAPFGFISLIHVLEHLPDPVSYLSGLADQWAADGASLLVEVPNVIFHDSFEPPHLVSYHRSSLIRTLETSGWNVRWTQAHGIPRSRRFPLYLTALATRGAARGGSQRSGSSPSAVRLKRSLGTTSYRLAARFIRWMGMDKKGLRAV